MTFPPDGTMLVLLSLWVDEGFLVIEGELHLSMPDGPAQQVEQKSLDHLEAVGWLAINDDGTVAVTDKGKYALDRWVTKKANARGDHGKMVLKFARVGSTRSTQCSTPSSTGSSPSSPLPSGWRMDPKKTCPTG